MGLGEESSQSPTSDPTLAEANRRLEQREWREAIEAFRSVVDRNPSEAALRGLGKALQKSGEKFLAVRTFRRLVNEYSRSAENWILLGNSYFHTDRLEKSLRCTENAIRLRPGSYLAYRLKASIEMRLGRFESCRKSCDQTLAIRPDDPESRMLLGMMALASTDCREGWDLYEARHEQVETDWACFDALRWHGESLDGKTIMLLAEQGLGDAIQFVRYATVLKKSYDCQVWLFCRTKLIPLFKAVEGIDRWFGNQKPPPACDYYIPVMSLPRFLSVDEVRGDTICPYLFPSDDRKAAWKSRLQKFDGTAKVGIAWRGNPDHEGDRFRSLAPEQIAGLARWKNVTWISLQKETDPCETDRMKGYLDLVEFEDLDSEGGLFEDTAALIGQLDLVITVDTALAHLAGALGKRVWVALAYSPDWRWGMTGESTLWYSGMRLYRQSHPGHWQPVIEAMSNDLGKELRDLTPKDPADFRLARREDDYVLAGRHGFFLVDPTDAEIGRSMCEYGEWAEEELAVLLQLLPQDGVAIELTSNTGVMTVPLARSAGPLGRVFAFEGLRKDYYRLCANIALNGLQNVDCRQARVTVETIEDLNVDQVHLVKADFGMTSIADVVNAEWIDRFRPALYLENVVGNRSPNLIRRLWTWGYAVYRHSPNVFSATNFFRNQTNRFPNLRFSNVLAIHQDQEADLTGFRRVETADDCLLRD